MERRTRRGILALGVLSFGLGLAPTGARAQLFGGGAPMPPSGGAAMLAGSATTPNNGMMGMFAGNPYMNPMMSPLLNPYMNTAGISSGNAALYFMTMQQMTGGIGSGKLGGPNAGRPSAGATTPPKAADGLRPTGANTPGATASRYFGRTTPANPGTSRYYARQSRYFPNNGR